MPSRTCWVFLVATLAICSVPPVVAAQERVTLRTRATLYGDNTEFFNPFRDGETLFGTAATIAVDVALNEGVTFSSGIFLNHRFASERFADRWRPVFQLILHKEHQRFIIGTLDSDEQRDGFGPDRTGPHGLLPPLQKETLAFTRPYEAGLQWKVEHPQLRQDAWINWQRLNTTDARERFDTGLIGRLPLMTAVPISIGYQVHLVHEGGQLFANGPVGESWAAGPGIIVEPTVWFFDRTVVEGYLMFSRDVPDRSDLTNSERGHGLFTRLSGEKNGWRGHMIIWGARDWIKTEGDENYGALRDDGTRFAATRHYGEVGLTKIFYPADGVGLEGSVRIHRVERDYNYSYRILARVAFDFLMWER